MKEKLLIGKTLLEAQELLRNCTYRIVYNDKSLTLPNDNVPGRFNLFLENGKIIGVKLG